MRKIIVIVVSVLAGCTTATEIHTASGTKGYTISCPFSGPAGAGWSECYAKASEICKTAGYDVLDKADDRNYSTSCGIGGCTGGQVNLRTMVIACKGQKKT